MLKAEIPTKKRSKFVSNTILEKLKRNAFAKALKNFKPIKGITEWQTPRSTKHWIKNMRNEDSHEIDKLWNT